MLLKVKYFTKNLNLRRQAIIFKITTHKTVHVQTTIVNFMIKILKLINKYVRQLQRCLWYNSFPFLSYKYRYF